jgi:hypothetical protein
MITSVETLLENKRRNMSHALSLRRTLRDYLQETSAFFQQWELIRRTAIFLEAETNYALGSPANSAC